MDKRKVIVGMDFGNVFLSGYYGEKLINGKGQNVNGIKTFFFRMKAIKEMFSPDYIVVAMDVGRSKTFRRNMYKHYKTNRKPKDDDIASQIEITSRICALTGYPIIENELYEADDILGMVSKYAYDHGMDMVIISSDQDMYQLLSENTYIYSPRGKEIIDEAWLYEKYRLKPSQWVDLKMLKGDPSDNVPGVEGVGEVTALKLMHQYESLDNIIQNIHQLKQNIQDNFAKIMDFLPISRELMTIVTDYNLIGFSQKNIEMNEPWTTELFNELDSLELSSLVNVFKYSLIPNESHIPSL